MFVMPRCGHSGTHKATVLSAEFENQLELYDFFSRNPVHLFRDLNFKATDLKEKLNDGKPNMPNPTKPVRRGKPAGMREVSRAILKEKQRPQLVEKWCGAIWVGQKLLLRKM